MEMTIAANVLHGSWEFADACTTELTHDLHRYSGKFIPQIAARAIQTLTTPGDTILDVFCGSGTTLLEAARLGRKAIGFDLNPLAVLIAKVKTTPVEPRDLDELRSSLTNDIIQFSSGDLFSQIESDDLRNFAKARRESEWNKKWYSSKILSGLVYIEYCISKIDNQSYRDIATISLSNILRRCSRAHSGYPNVMFDKNSSDRADPTRLFLKELEHNCDMVRQLWPLRESLAEVGAFRENSCKLSLQDEVIDAIITHPPYIGSIPYAEYGCLSLNWLGFDHKELDNVLTGGKRQSKKVVDRFAADYKKIIAEAFRVLKKGGGLFLMVGNPVVKGELIDLTEMSIEFANDAGFQLTVQTTREGINRRANKMGVETLLFFHKC